MSPVLDAEWSLEILFPGHLLKFKWEDDTNWL